MNNNSCCQMNTCPRLTPIVCPERVCYVTRCFPVEQPIIVPYRTHTINQGVIVNRYYPTYSTSEETRCPGQAGASNQTNMNI